MNSPSFIQGLLDLSGERTSQPIDMYDRIHIGPPLAFGSRLDAIPHSHLQSRPLAVLDVGRHAARAASVSAGSAS
jgi:hypothetical protein